MRRKEDMLWKEVLEEVFEDLVTFVFPEAEGKLDFQRGIEFLDKELAEIHPGGKTPVHFVDKLGKVHYRDGSSEWILIHVEVQGKAANRESFPERMFRYYYRIFDLHRNPITAIALFTGEDAEKIPGKYRSSCWGTTMEYCYNTISIPALTDEELQESKNPFALVLLAARAALQDRKFTQEYLLAKKISLARTLFSKGLETKKVRAIFKFLDNYVGLSDMEMNRTFKEQLLSKNRIHMVDTLAYLEKEAVKEATKEYVRNLLLNGKLSVEDIATALGVSLNFVKKVKREMNQKN